MNYYSKKNINLDEKLSLEKSLIWDKDVLAFDGSHEFQVMNITLESKLGYMYYIIILIK